MLELERERNDNDGSGEEKTQPGQSGAGFEETSHSPMAREDWARLAMDLGVQSVHIAERDTQFSAQRKEKGEFVNTWSVDGFLSEGNQPAELGWGTFEKTLPADAGDEHTFGPNSAIFLKQPGASTMVRSWTPQAGPFHGFLITHSESISIATYLTLFGPEGKAVYRVSPCSPLFIPLSLVPALNFPLCFTLPFPTSSLLCTTPTCLATMQSSRFTSCEATTTVMAVVSLFLIPNPRVLLSLTVTHCLFFSLHTHTCSPPALQAGANAGHCRGGR